MKKLLKILLFSMVFVSAMNASGFKRLGQKLSGFGRAMTPGILVASAMQKSNSIEVPQALPAASWNQDLKEEFKDAQALLTGSFSDALRRNTDLLDEGCSVDERYSNWRAQCEVLSNFCRQIKNDCSEVAFIIGLGGAVVCTHGVSVVPMMSVFMAEFIVINRLRSIFEQNKYSIFAKNPILLREKNPEFYYIVYRKMIKDLGLQNVNIKIYVVESMVHPGVLGYKTSIESFFDKNGYVFQVVLTLCDDDAVNAIILRHELAHVQQTLSQSEGIGLRPSIHEGGIVPKRKLNQKLKEQAADAAGCGYIDCPECLRNFASLESTFDPAKLNDQGYCVSDRGYFSAEEILEYVKARELDGELCEKHAQKLTKVLKEKL